MRVLINATPTFGPRSGIGHYVAELLRCLSAQARSSETIVAHPAQWLGRLRSWLGPAGKAHSPGSKSSRSGVSVARAVARSLMREYFRAVVTLGRFDLYHEPNFIPSPCRIPTVATIHDLSAILHPEWHPAERVGWFEKHFPSVPSRCVHFFAISESARREIVRELGIPASRITCTYMGVRPWLRPMPRDEVAPVLRSLGLPGSYLLCVGTIEPRKNVLTLLRAYCDLPSAVREKCPLVLAGGWGWKAEPVADYFDSTARQRNVTRLGYVPEEALGAVYNGARALAFPSLYEGFGLPPVEMLACGGAVLASTAPAVAEVAGDPAHLIDPHDLAGWRDALLRVIEDDDWHAQLCRGAVERARPFTWDACAARTLDAYRHITAGRHDCAPSDTPSRAA